MTQKKCRRKRRLIPRTITFLFRWFLFLVPFFYFKFIYFIFYVNLRNTWPCNHVPSNSFFFLIKKKWKKRPRIIGKLKWRKWQCESMSAVEKKLKEMGMEYTRQKVVEGGIEVDQLFFHDPDGFMIEICNCDNLPVIPLAGQMVRTCSRLNLQMQQQQPMPVVKL